MAPQAPQASQPFPEFSGFPEEIKSKIFQFAAENEESRVIDIRLCARDHHRGVCYVRHPLSIEESQTSYSEIYPFRSEKLIKKSETFFPRNLSSPCCYHQKSPLFIDINTNICQCILSRWPTEAPEKDWEELVTCMEKKQVSGMLDANLIQGHGTRGDYHMCRSKHSHMSPLLQTCQNSRREAKKIGLIRFTQSVQKYRVPVPRVSDIYFNFKKDVLFYSIPQHHFGLAAGMKWEGLSKVKRLILALSQKPVDRVPLKFCNMKDNTIEQPFTDFTIPHGNPIITDAFAMYKNEWFCLKKFPGVTYLDIMYANSKHVRSVSAIRNGVPCEPSSFANSANFNVMLHQNTIRSKEDRRRFELAVTGMVSSLRKKNARENYNENEIDRKVDSLFFERMKI